MLCRQSSLESNFPSKSVKPQESQIPFNPDGSVAHLGVKKGQLSNLLITVGQAERAIHLANNLLSQVSVISSPRHFTVCNGFYGPKEESRYFVSIVAIGIGYPNMDLFVREARAVIPEGPLYIIRLGTCGSFDEQAAPIGSIVAPTHGIIKVSEQFGEGLKFYPSLTPDSALLQDILNNSLQVKGKYSADFDDSQSEGLVATLREQLGVQTIDMETWYLFYLASKCISTKGRLHAAAVVIPNANRVIGKFLNDRKEREKLELEAGKICLEALIKRAEQS